MALLASLTQAARAAFPFVQQLTRLDSTASVVQDTISSLTPAHLASFPAPIQSAIGRLRAFSVEGAVGRALSGNEIVALLRVSGVGARRTDLLAMIADERKLVQTKPYIQSVRNDLMPNPARFAEAQTQMKNNFSYLVRAEGYNRLTGENAPQFVWISTPEVWTKNQVYDMAQGFLEGTNLSGNFAQSSMTVEEVRRSPSAVF